MTLKIPSSAYKMMPWKNGLGVTAEIDRHPAEGAYLWRLSQATISSDGPFSSFAGYDRWLFVWRGESVFLNDVKVDPLRPHQFSGDNQTICRLTNGTVKDVGLIYDRAKVRAEMRVASGEVALRTKVTYLFDLDSGDTLKFEGPTRISVEPSLLVELDL